MLDEPPEHSDAYVAGPARGLPVVDARGLPLLVIVAPAGLHEFAVTTVALFQLRMSTGRVM
ncbi:hypothetical protein ABT173_46245 [Streptomyces sp. NPDC001795]|uniref:hypothetical protein n=1 Tax=Streptomyces sp. NPDC001795 TaxID=3154525 RepID=UPI00332D71EF